MPFGEAEGHIVGNDRRELSTNPAQSETPGMLGNSIHENRETPLVTGSKRPDRQEKATSYKTSVQASGESDERVVPGKYPNKGAVRPAEGMKGSRSTKGNTEENRTLRAQDRDGVSQGLQRVRESSPQGQETEVHHAATPCHGRTTAGQRLVVKEEGCAWSGDGHRC